MPSNGSRRFNYSYLLTQKACRAYVLSYIHTHAHTHMHVHTCTHVCTYSCSYLDAHMFVHTLAHAYVHACVFVLSHIHARTNVSPDSYIISLTHTQAQARTNFNPVRSLARTCIGNRFLSFGHFTHHLLPVSLYIRTSESLFTANEGNTSHLRSKEWNSSARHHMLCLRRDLLTQT